MVRLVAACLLGIGLAPLQYAGAGEIGPICRIPSVLDVIARELRQHDYYARINPRFVAEFPDGMPTRVLCSALVWTLTFDARWADGVPIGRFEQHVFEVRALPNGFVVRYLR